MPRMLVKFKILIKQILILATKFPQLSVFYFYSFAVFVENIAKLLSFK